VVLEPARPVGRHPDLATTQDVEHVLRLVGADDLAHPDGRGLLRRHAQRQVAIGEAQHQVFTSRAEYLQCLDALDHGGAVPGVHDLVTDAEAHRCGSRFTGHSGLFGAGPDFSCS